MASFVKIASCEGNPGALAFMMEAYGTTKTMDDLFKVECAFARVINAGITGSKLYMLWNDCCGRNTDKAIQIMFENDIDDIKKHINYENGRGIPYEE